MRIIYLLALFSAFFVSSNDDGIPRFYDPTPVSPEYDTVKTWQCRVQNGARDVGGTIIAIKSPDGACSGPAQKWLKDSIPQDHCEIVDEQVKTSTRKVEITYKIKNWDSCDTPKTVFSSTTYGAALVSESEPKPTCPPQGHPEYSFLFRPGGGQPFCFKMKGDDDSCGAGYHTSSVSRQLGSDTCVPNKCDSAGTPSNLYSSKKTGGVPFDSAGVYCHDGCAYSVSQKNIGSKSTATGVSVGAFCGDKPYEKSKLADHEDQQTCDIFATSSGRKEIKCTTPKIDDPDRGTDPITGEDNKQDEKQPEKEQKKECGGDASCENENIQVELKNQFENLVLEMQQMHNKAIEQSSLETNTLRENLENLESMLYIQTDSLVMNSDVTNDNLDYLGDSIDNLATAIDNGNGNGGGDGDCTGPDCAPSIGTNANRRQGLLNDIFVESDVVAVKNKAESKRSELRDLYSSITSDLNSSLDITPSISGGYEQRSISLYGENIDISFSRFSSFYQMLASPLMLIAVITAMFIMLGKTND